jgi:hypothetical protein
MPKLKPRGVSIKTRTGHRLLLHMLAGERRGEGGESFVLKRSHLTPVPRFRAAPIIPPITAEAQHNKREGIGRRGSKAWGAPAPTFP